MEEIFNFDAAIDRRSSDSLKWHKFRPDVLPMFVADMDFKSPACITRAIEERAAHGCYGYASPPQSVLETVWRMLDDLYGWKVEPSSIVFLPGLVPALAMAARMTARAGNKIIVPTPCYPPFVHAPRYMDCESILVPLKCEDFSNWTLDYAALDQAVAQGGRTLYLCNPQNPTGHVFRRGELEALAAWAERHDVLIISDEIHAGLVLDEELRHIPIGSLSSTASARTITLMAPSKTFNVPGIGIGFAIIPDAELRKRFKREGEEIVPMPSLFGYAVCEAAYREGGAWQQALIRYLRVNRDLVVKTLEPYRRFVRVNRPEATYLSWLDASGTGWENPALEFLERGRVALGVGAQFQAPQCARLTFGCPRTMLMEGLERVVKVLDHLSS